MLAIIGRLDQLRDGQSDLRRGQRLILDALYQIAQENGERAHASHPTTERDATRKNLRVLSPQGEGYAGDRLG